MTCALGSKNGNLPRYEALGNNQGVKRSNPNWNFSFLPTTYQGTLFRPEGAPVVNLNPPSDVERSNQRAQLDLLTKFNTLRRAEHPEESELLGRIEIFELAYRMQMEATSSEMRTAT